MMPVSPVSRRTPSEARSIGEALAGHRNSLGILRLVLAALVIVDHAFPLGGFGEDPFWVYTRGQTSLGGIAVGGFFAISGYLIVKSGASADIVQFVWRRVIRIFPAFWGALLFGALVVGPVAWTVRGSSLETYFQAEGQGPWGYLAHNWTLTIGQYGILDVFTGTPYGQSVHASVLNGSLWTLAYELGCYLMIGVLAIGGVLRHARMVVPVLALFVVAIGVIQTATPGTPGAVLPLLGDPQVIFLASAFLAGAAIGIYSDKVPYNDQLGVLSGIVFVVSLFYGGFAAFGVVAGAYFLMYLAVRLPRQLQWIGSKNDYSYGVYVYGFLVQQSLAAAGVHEFGYVPYVVVALVLTSFLAWASWHGLEKRALALKSWGPGKGWRYWVSRLSTRSVSRGGAGTSAMKSEGREIDE